MRAQRGLFCQADAGGEACEVLVARQTRIDPSTSEDSADPLPAPALTSIPSRLANFAAAAHSSSGSRDRTECVLRNSSNRRRNCSTSS
jgi:hypothetical protein